MKYGISGFFSLDQCLKNGVINISSLGIVIASKSSELVQLGLTGMILDTPTNSLGKRLNQVCFAEPESPPE